MLGSFVMLSCLVCLSHAVSTNTVAPSSPSCWVVKDTSPFRTCREEAEPLICQSGYGVYDSQELCCTPGAAFTEGCSSPPDQCWVVENQKLRTCIKDQRKCLQGQGVFASQALCCTPGMAFPDGCGKPALSPTPCWVVDTHFPARTCKQTRRLCVPEAGLTLYPSKEACCVPKAGAFPEGCSASVPTAPCFVVDTYDPIRKCRMEDSLAACNRGYGVYVTEEMCCTPGAAFPDGCSRRTMKTSG